MKIYRVVPDTFNLNHKRESRTFLGKMNYCGFEELYYKLGYTSFIQNENLKLTYCTDNGFSFKKNAKFFFLYPENCLKAAKDIISSKNLYCGSYILLEYDFPPEVLVKYIGHGVYATEKDHIQDNLCIEFLIPAYEFGKFTNSKYMRDKNNKKDIIFLEQLDKSFKLIDDETLNSSDNNIWGKAFDISSYYYEERNYKDSILYSEFKKDSDMIIRSKHITGNMAYFHEQDMKDFVLGKDFRKIFAERGFDITGIITKPDDLQYEWSLLSDIKKSDDISTKTKILKNLQMKL